MDMDMKMKELKNQIEDLAGQVTIVTSDDINSMGRMLNLLDEMKVSASSLGATRLGKILDAFKGYVGQMVLGETGEMLPLEEGLEFIRRAQHCFETGEPLDFEMVAVSRLLGGTITEETPPSPIDASQTSGENQDGPSEQAQTISADDLEILSDFVSESTENLESIEINLVELESDPTNKEIINDIFRPFHTIKGVSAFLDLKKMNKLAHVTETFLDRARNREFLINDVATDAILISVDIMKKLLQRTSEGVQRKTMPQDDDIDIETIIYQLTELPAQIINDESEKVGGILIRKHRLDRSVVESALEKQRSMPARQLGEILIADENVDENDVNSALMDQKTLRKNVASQVKVSTDKLDDLVDLAGELVIAQSMLRQKASADPALHNSLSQLGQIVTSMQSVAMSMRMVQIKSTFMKMIRLVRDLSRKSGKKVKLEMQGEDTEIDRNVVEALYEPMVHMIRNSVDHAIEPGEERSLAGKSPQGKIMLRAFHKGGNIIIEIEDDGKGLDRKKIFKKAVSVGLLKSDDTPTDQQIDQLIMAPGFSTASKITDISGRGVGMDVVKKAIEKLRGQLTIVSRPGLGVKFIIALPLTLAIIDGMLVRIGKEKYILPTLAVSRSFRPEKANCNTVQGTGELVKDGDTLIPLIRMTRFTRIENEFENPWEGLVVVLESREEKRGFLVDELLGRDEYVIKNLGYSLEHVKGVSGGAILGDGTVGLILDVHGLFALAIQ
ncbi:chemotaxis protein CheA [Desulfocicer niacini]